MSIVDATALEGMRIFVLEDEPLIAIDLEYLIGAAGAATVDVCLSMSDDILKVASLADAAVLDLSIKGVSSVPVVLELRAMNIPTLIITGQSGDTIDPVIDDVPRLSKPFDNGELLEWLASSTGHRISRTA